MEIGIIIPIHNEIESLPSLHTRLEKALDDLERSGERRITVLHFDNGSTDGTTERLPELFGGSARYLIHRSKTNVGIGGAIRNGMDLVSGEVIVSIDGDCSYDPANVRLLLDAIDNGYDVLTGSPYHPQGTVENVPGWRLALSRGLSTLYRVITPLDLHTFTSMFRAYRRTVLETIQWRSDGYLSTCEMLMESSAAGFRIYEIPMTLRAREFGVSKIKVVEVIRNHVAYLFTLATDRDLRSRIAHNNRQGQ